MTFALAFLIGFFGGLRSLTAPAVVAWAAYLGWIKLDGPLSFMGMTPSVFIFSILAAVEYVVDKLPKTPPRTAPMGLGARIAGGALCGACVAQAGGRNAIVGGILGAIGGVVGCFAGYQARVRAVKAAGGRDLIIAVAEDVTAIVGSLLVVSRGS